MKVLQVTPWAPNGHCRLDEGSRLPHSFARMFCPVHRGPPDGRRRDVAHIQLLGTGGTIVGTATPRRSHQPLPLPSAGFHTARVEISTACPDATPDLMDFALRVGAHAIVLAGTGVGNAGPGFAERVSQAVESGCAVILSTRTPWGPVVPYYRHGGGTDLVAAGAIPPGTSTPSRHASSPLSCLPTAPRLPSCPQRSGPTSRTSAHPPPQEATCPSRSTCPSGSTWTPSAAGSAPTAARTPRGTSPAASSRARSACPACSSSPSDGTCR